MKSRIIGLFDNIIIESERILFNNVPLLKWNVCGKVAANWKVSDNSFESVVACISWQCQGYDNIYMVNIMSVI